MGRNNPDLKNEMESGYRRQENYQVAQWNRLTCSVIRSNTHSRFPQPKIIQSPSTDNLNPVVFKQLRHLPTKSIPIRYGNYIKAASTDEKRYRVREKNWLRRLRARNKKKKKLPPLPRDHVGDSRIYYKRTYNIDLFDYKVRKLFNVSSIP
ncbi:hypothetical protein RhiirA5_428744 [Rhizophagus irregularis]|uniref:Uncharacterized protein n=1 Tax=Rhizophagus irregularis TaxID=588596 RepID=A0A2N0NU58_9GLOM|nr:hypothetical protein RhiirA5_431905 [Rhizophagus irregularis]PKB99339.1 hypothetical protein RhiirA5_429866 [Rhizophagus irregularis]PKC00064.1 hypothetical protein RhiirA5_428744 [Rhizophagus irregularis]